MHVYLSSKHHNEILGIQQAHKSSFMTGSTLNEKGQGNCSVCPTYS